MYGFKYKIGQVTTDLIYNILLKKYNRKSAS